MKAIQFNGFSGENAVDGKWFTYYNKWSKCRFTFDPWWYFDERPCISTNLTTLLMFICIGLSFFTTWWLLLSLVFIFIGWGEMYIHLPYDSGKTDECESPQYGFYFECIDSPQYTLFEHLVICKGKDNKYIHMPWSFDWYRTSIKRNAGYWEHEFKGDRKDFYKEEWNNVKETFQHDYTDSYDGEVISTKITTGQREWRRRWLMWTTLFNKVSTYIDIEFSKEVGKKKGSYKGGVTGCSHELKKDETPLECIKRMEKERKF